ncbi:hypothetical protein E4U53_006473 [Claviceps sorghi]|nr:hypothetical protein E4U53_006473 [Claviceps sorghi]
MTLTEHAPVHVLDLLRVTLDLTPLRAVQDQEHLILRDWEKSRNRRRATAYHRWGVTISRVTEAESKAANGMGIDKQRLPDGSAAVPDNPGEPKDSWQRAQCTPPGRVVCTRWAQPYSYLHCVDSSTTRSTPGGRITCPWSWKHQR